MVKDKHFHHWYMSYASWKYSALMFSTNHSRILIDMKQPKWVNCVSCNMPLSYHNYFY
jgi:hypothetical protein